MKKSCMKLVRVLLLPLILIAFVFPLSAQEKGVELSLNEAIDSAVSNNDHVRLSRMDEEIATSNYKQTQAVFLPQLGFSYTAMTTNNPLNAFGFKLQQQSITAADFNPERLNNPPGTPDFMTKFQLQQPLINVDMWYMRKGAAKQMEVYQYKTQRTKEYITFQVKQAYLQLQLAYDAKSVLEEALETARAMYQSTRNYFEQGLVQKSDLLNAQVQVTKMETKIAEVNSNIQDASDALSLLMGRSKGTTYSIPSSFRFSAIETVDSLPETRADFKAMESAISAYDLMIKSNKLSFLPKLNAFASYQFNDNSMFGFGSNAYLAGVRLSWDIFKGNTTRNKIATQTLERNKLAAELETQKSESELELNKARRQLAIAEFAINQEKEAVAQAQEALRILQDRYEQGLVKTTDVLMAQTQLSEQKLSQTQSVFAANMATAYLQFLTNSNL